MSLFFRFIVTVTLCFSTTAFALESNNASFFTINGAFGVGNYNHAINQEDQAIGRLSLGGMIRQGNFGFGIEGGLQTGNTIRFDFPEEDIFALGGVPIEVHIKPLMDILLTVRMDMPEKSLYGMFKGGIAYRQMHADRQSVNNVTNLSPELQALIGFKVSKEASIHLTYQYIFGAAPTLKVNPNTETGILSHIPQEQALMLGFTYNF